MSLTDTKSIYWLTRAPKAGQVSQGKWEDSDWLRTPRYLSGEYLPTFKPSSSYKRCWKLYLQALSCERHKMVESRRNAWTPSRRSSYLVEWFSMKKVGTIKRAGCLVTGCQIKMASRSRSSRPMAHPCEVMRGNTSIQDHFLFQNNLCECHNTYSQN